MPADADHRIDDVSRHAAGSRVAGGPLLITGATGYIGGGLVTSAISLADAVRAKST